MHNWFVLAISSAAAAITTLCGLLVAVGKARSATYELLRSARSRVRIVGIPSGTVVPEVLISLPAFNDYKSAVLSGSSVVVLTTTTLSKALRLCDWVIVDPKADAKVIIPTSEAGRALLQAIVTDHTAAGAR